jgi:hypothetical protein
MAQSKARELWFEPSRPTSMGRGASVDMMWSFLGPEVGQASGITR